MNKVFQYSLLQYKHSLALNEAVNVGILFYFPENSTLEFVPGILTRVKSIYDEFDAAILNQLIKGIAKKNADQDNLFKKESLKANLKKQIFTTVLNEDSTALQFTDPVTVVNTFSNYSKAVEAYSRILLPGLQEEQKDIKERHTDLYLIKKLTSYVSKNKAVEKKLKHNEFIETQNFKFRFEIGWQNGTYNLVKSISFDLTDEQSIQAKSANYFGYLTLLNENKFAEKKNYKFDLLITKPQNKALFKAYDNALEILNKAKAPKEIVTEDKLRSYSEKLIDELKD